MVCRDGRGLLRTTRRAGRGARSAAAAEALERRALLSGTVAGGAGDAFDHEHDDLCDHGGERYVAPSTPARPAVSGWVGLGGAFAQAAGTAAADVFESEPNNTPAGATPISVGGANGAVSAAIGTAGDDDYYSFTLTQKSGVFFDVDARDTGVSSLDSQITVYNAAGGQMAVNDDGDDFETFALNDTAATARSLDASLYADLGAGSYVVRVSSSLARPATTGAYVFKARADASYTSGVPDFSSLPGAADTLYLDFDGYGATDAWGTYSIAAFDFNNAPGEWSPAERAAVETVWRVVADDYAPFNINVTTKEPATIGDGVAHRQVIGNGDGSEVGATGSLGVAYRPSYNSGGPGNNVAFTFANNFGYLLGGGGVSAQLGAKAVEMGNTSSHEFGHALGLRHYGGATNGQRNGIMHTPDFGLSRERWAAGNTHDGESPVVAQVDVDTVSSTSTTTGLPNNTFGYRADDHGNSTAAARVLTATAGVYTASGAIERASDSDYFRFTTSGVTSLAVDMPEHVANLDAELYLYDSAGTQVNVSDPSGSIFASLSQLNLAAGTYYAAVRSDAGAGEVGQYTLRITTPVPASATPGAPDLLPAYDSGVSTADNLTSRDNSSAEKTLQFSVPNTVSGATVTIYADGVAIGSKAATGTTTTVGTTGLRDLADGSRTITARQSEPGKSESASSAALAVTVDTVAPPTPGVPDLRASSDTGLSATDDVTADNTPTFDVNLEGAAYFHLYRNGAAVTEEGGATSSVTLAPTADGSHGMTVALVDLAGNRSAVGTRLNVAIDTAGPTGLAEQPPLVSTAGGTAYDVRIQYSDFPSGIDAGTLGTGDVLVTGPNGFTQSAAFVLADPPASQSVRATYRLTPPGGAWDRADNGTYTLTLPPAEVKDVAGNAAAAGALGTFAVNILAAPSAPDLHVNFDTGSSDADDVTRRNNATTDERLAFVVGNTEFGARVALFADGVEVGAATASGPTTTVFTRAAAGTFADGVHQFTARQAPSGGSNSPESPSLAVTVDTLAPTADVTDVSPDPRTTPVDAATVTFSRPVAGVSANSLRLTRDGVAVPLSSTDNAPTTADGVMYTVPNLAALTGTPGTYVLTVRANAGSPVIADALAGNPMAADASDTWVVETPPPDAAPVVTGVFVSGLGEAWADAFRGFLATSGAGEAAFGYALGAGQPDELPWANLRVVSVRFSEDVNVAADDLVVRGVNVATYAPLADAGTPAFTYDAASFTATWRLGRAVGPDKLLLDLDADAGTGVTDLGGLRLDGEWPSPAAAAPAPVAGDAIRSGDGTPGGDFRFRLNVLPGDVNRNGGVTANDLNLVKLAQGAAPGGGLYTIYKDVNGSGSIFGSDVNLVRAGQGHTLPAAEPAAPPPPAEQSPRVAAALAPATPSKSTLKPQKKRLVEGLL